MTTCSGKRKSCCCGSNSLSQCRWQRTSTNRKWSTARLLKNIERIKDSRETDKLWLEELMRRGDWEREHCQIWRAERQGKHWELERERQVKEQMKREKKVKRHQHQEARKRREEEERLQCERISSAST
jgi:hypothetical protein